MSSGAARVAEQAGRYRWVILGLAFTGQMSNALAGQAVAPLAPLFQAELGLSKAEVGLFSTAAFAGAWGVLLVAGFLTDRFGVRKMLTVGQLVVGGVLMSMSLVGSFFQAAAVMFAAGLGRGTLAPGVSKAIIDWFPPSARATTMGIKQTGVPISGIITASTLPALGLAIGWRSAIAVVGIWMIAGAIAAAVLYRDTQTPGQVQVRRVSMRSSLGAVIGNADLWSLSLVALLFGAVQAAVTTYLLLYLEEVVLVPVVPDRSVRIVTAGGYLALCQVGGVVSRIGWGMVSDRFFRSRRMVVLVIVGALAALVSAAVGYLGDRCPLWLLTVLVFAYGASAIGWGGLYLAMAAEISGRKYAATGVGMSMTIMQLGNVGGAPLFGLLVDATGSYATGWMFLAFLSLGGTLLAAVSARRQAQVA